MLLFGPVDVSSLSGSEITFKFAGSCGCLLLKFASPIHAPWFLRFITHISTVCQIALKNLEACEAAKGVHDGTE